MQHTFLPELTTRVSNTVLELPFWADWWIPWSSVTREEDLWSMRRSCIMGLWPDGSAPVKRLVTWTLSRPVPMSISIASMEKDGWSWNTVWYPSELLFKIGTETEFLLCCRFRTYLLSTVGYWNWVSALLQIWKLLCPIIYWSNLSTMWTPLITTMLRTIHPCTVTDHLGDLASISKRLTVLDWELSKLPTTLRTPLATLLSSLLVIQGRPCCGPYFLLHTFEQSNHTPRCS